MYLHFELVDGNMVLICFNVITFGNNRVSYRMDLKIFIRFPSSSHFQLVIERNPPFMSSIFWASFFHTNPATFQCSLSINLRVALCFFCYRGQRKIQPEIGSNSSLMSKFVGDHSR